MWDVEDFVTAFNTAVSRPRAAKRVAAAIFLALTLSACNTSDTVQHGFIADGRALDQIKPGTDVQTVLSTLGTPSTVSTVGNKTFYYISQTTRRPVQFMEPQIVDQRVLTIYFNKSFKVERVANYGLQDGKVFDFISRTTPTSGSEQNIVQNLMRGLLRW